MKTASRARERAPDELDGPVYLDSSGLAKLYLPEPDSATLERVLRGRTDLLVSDLVVTEIVSAVSRRRRAGGITTTAAGPIHRALLAHLQGGLYRAVDLSPGVHREAERLLLALEAIPLRAADALHVALALAAGAATVVTFDARLAAASRAVGLRSFP